MCFIITSVTPITSNTSGTFSGCDAFKECDPCTPKIKSTKPARPRAPQRAASGDSQPCSAPSTGSSAGASVPALTSWVHTCKRENHTLRQAHHNLHDSAPGPPVPTRLSRARPTYFQKPCPRREDLDRGCGGPGWAPPAGMPFVSWGLVHRGPVCKDPSAR